MMQDGGREEGKDIEQIEVPAEEPIAIETPVEPGDADVQPQ